MSKVPLCTGPDTRNLQPWWYRGGTRLQGYLALRTSPPQDPIVALCLGTYGDPRERGISYERGTPVTTLCATVWNSLSNVCNLAFGKWHWSCLV